MLYRKKPVVIEAIKWTGENDLAIEQLLGCKPYITPMRKIKIQTLEGEHTADKGDYIIKGVKGEFYPCKPDIFEMTYEKVDL